MRSSRFLERQLPERHIAIALFAIGCGYFGEIEDRFAGLPHSSAQIYILKKQEKPGVKAADLLHYFTPNQHAAADDPIGLTLLIG